MLLFKNMGRLNIQRATVKKALELILKKEYKNHHFSCQTFASIKRTMNQDIKY